MTIELCVWKITANKSLDRIAQHDQGLITFLKNKTCYLCDGRMRSCPSYEPAKPGEKPAHSLGGCQIKYYEGE